MSTTTNQRGFTLIEILVSTAIFIVVMVIAMGSLLSISTANNKAETVKTVMDNLNFALDSMSRSVRTGVNYHCTTSGDISTPAPNDCPSGSDYFVFLASSISQPDCVSGSSCVVTYCLGDTNTATCGSGTSILRNVYNGSTNTGYVPLTATEVVVDSLTFYVVGAPLADDTQPRVTIVASGHTNFGSTAEDTSFDVQTSITQRLYDE